MTIRILSGLLCALLLCVSILADEPEVPKKKLAEIKRVVAVRGAVQIQASKQLADALQVVTKKLNQALRASGEATVALAAAEKAAAAATSEEEKKAAAKQVDEAKKQLDAARKAVTKLRAEASKASQAATLDRFVRNLPGVAVRENVDSEDPIERFALLTPGGPLIIEVAMTIDGQPYRVAREKLVDQRIADADKDKDGKATWDEALKATRFTAGRVRIGNEQQRQAYIKMLDQNRNGLVERGEVRQFLARFFQGPAFNLVGGTGSRGGFGSVLTVNGRMVNQGGGQADVHKLLDTDDNGVLDEKEIAAAPERLKSRDANDNDLLLPNEINGTDRATAVRQVRTRSRQPQPQLVMLLGPTTKAELLFAALQQKYKNDNGDIAAASFSAVPKLFESLDENQDGKLQQDELLALNETKPHIEMAVALGKTDGSKGLTLKSLAPELVKMNESAETISVELPGIKVSLAANLTTRTYNYERTGTSLLTRYDKDNNGYLEKDEIPGNVARQFEMWDADEDGKVYAKEIVATYTRMLAPQMSQVRATAANQGNPLFQALDQSGDGRLSLREMRTASQRINTFDEDKDNRITQGEIPVTLSVMFSLGNASTAVYRTAAGGRPGTNRPVASGAPEWFTRMDRNGDGDVTLKEFLADEKEFKKLDTNDDGFIEPKEAKQAEGSK